MNELVPLEVLPALSSLEPEEFQPAPPITAVEIFADYAGIYGMGSSRELSPEPPVYLIIPDAGSVHVQHQFGCVSCLHLDWRDCRLFALYGMAATALYDALSPCRPNHALVEEAVRSLFGADVSVGVNVYEGLVHVTSDSVPSFYLATLNCD